MNESKRLVYGKHSSLKLYTLCKSIEVNFYLQVFSSLVISYHVCQEDLDLFFFFFKVLLPYSLGPKTSLSGLFASSHSKGENLILELQGSEATRRVTGKPIQQLVFLKSRIRQQENKSRLFFPPISSQSQGNSLESHLCLAMDNRNENICNAKEENNKYNTWIF